MAELKEKIAKEHGHAVDQQKLISSGKILENEQPLSHYGLKEGDFVVLMVTKPSQKSTPAPATTSTPAATSTVSPAKKETPASTTPATSAIPAPAPAANPAPATSTFGADALGTNDLLSRI